MLRVEYSLSSLHDHQPWTFEFCRNFFFSSHKLKVVWGFCLRSSVKTKARWRKANLALFELWPCSFPVYQFHHFCCEFVSAMECLSQFHLTRAEAMILEVLKNFSFERESSTCFTLLSDVFQLNIIYSTFIWTLPWIFPRVVGKYPRNHDSNASWIQRFSSNIFDIHRHTMYHILDFQISHVRI